jgi:Uma2 family endonuclease
MDRSAIETDPILRVSPEMAGVRMSPGEFDSVREWDDSYDYELVQGVLVVVPPVSEAERGPNDSLGYWLQAYQENHPEGASLDLTLPESMIRTPHNRRRADRAIWSGLGRVPNVSEDPPTVAIEFVSAGKRSFQRDYLDKRDEYLAAGLLEYWIIDRFRRRMVAVRGRSGSPQEIVVPEDQFYTTPLLPGFELPLAQLLARADALDPTGTPDRDA